jgi:hypothetical protein
MAITRPTAKNADAFIAGAPDATTGTQQTGKKAKKLQISLTVAEPLLARVDALASRLGLSRAAVVNLALTQAVESGFSVDRQKPV